MVSYVYNEYIPATLWTDCMRFETKLNGFQHESASFSIYLLNQISF